MKIIALIVMAWSLTACMNMQEFNEQQRQKPQTYPNHDPNCTRHIPTSQAVHPPKNPYLQDGLNHTHCR